MPPSATGRVSASAPRAEGRRLRRAVTAGLLLLAVLPAVAGLVDLWLDRGEPFLPQGDHALLTLVVDAVGHHEVLLGPYSRFDWYHPGPMGAYLLAAPYFLLGGALEAMTVGMLVISGLSTAAAIWLVRRRAGLVAATWVLLVLALSLQTLGGEFLRDSWNPYLPVLPFLAGVLLCWAAIRGDAWALPLAVVPLSLAAQSHVGFLPAVGSVGAVLVVGLLLRAVRRRRRRSAGVAGGEPAQPVRRLRRWLIASVVAVAVGLVLWLPTIVQQVTGSPGNLGVLYEDLLRNSPEQPAGVPAGLRAVVDEFGRLPAHLMGTGVTGAPLLPARWPPLAIGIGMVLFVGAMAVAVARRREDVLWLGVLTLAVAAAGVSAVARIDGWTFAYLTRWTIVIGVLAWTTIGLSLLPELAAGIRRAVGSRRPTVRPGTLIGVPVGALAAAAVVVASVGAVRAGTPASDPTGGIARLSQAVITDLDRRGLTTGTDRPVVRVDLSPTSRPEIVGTFDPGGGVVLALHREEVDVQLDDAWRIEFGERYTARPDEAGYVVTVAYSDGTSPPPAPWQQVLAVAGEFEVYGGVPPAG